MEPPVADETPFPSAGMNRIRFSGFFSATLKWHPDGIQTVYNIGTQNGKPAD